MNTAKCNTSERVEMGVSRVTELENVLGELIDLFDHAEYPPMHGECVQFEDGAPISEVVDRARVILARDDEEFE